MQRNCEYCQKRFEAKRHRRCCDRSCSAKLSMEARGKVPWQPEELELIHELAGYQSKEAIARRVQKLDKQKGWPCRTVDAVTVRLFRMGYSKRPIFDNIPRDNLAKLLGVSRDRARSWTRNFRLPSKKGALLVTIRLSDFRRWAYANPSCVAGIESDRLNWIMDDEEFCEKAEASPQPRIGRSVPIVRLSDGKTFTSLRAAARETFISKAALSAALKTGGTSAGSRWAYANSEDAIAPAR